MRLERVLAWARQNWKGMGGGSVERLDDHEFLEAFVAAVLSYAQTYLPGPDPVTRLLRATNQPMKVTVAITRRYQSTELATVATTRSTYDAAPGTITDRALEDLPEPPAGYTDYGEPMARIVDIEAEFTDG